MSKVIDLFASRTKRLETNYALRTTQKDSQREKKKRERREAKRREKRKRRETHRREGKNLI